MAALSILDLGFLVAESTVNPKHVAILLVFTKPVTSPGGFVKKLYGQLLRCGEVKSPFNEVISFLPTPHWRDAGEVDLERHVFYHRLKRGEADRKSLYRLVAQLHTPVLDRSRPLWELHVIDGLDQARFAMYQKTHHAYADGVTLTRWTAAALAKSAEDLRLTPLWTRPGGAEGASAEKRKQRPDRVPLGSAARAGRLALGLARLGAALLQESVYPAKNAVALPFMATVRTPLTGTVTAGRQYTCVAVPMERMEQLRARTSSTVNHLALTCIDGALRRYLKDLRVEARRPLTIQMPVSLRREGETLAGSRIGIVQVELSPPTDDPNTRLRNIGSSLRGVRALVDSVGPEAILSYTLVTNLVAQLAETVSLSDRMNPIANTLVSDVRGPTDSLYLKGARLEEMQLIGMLPPGNLVNITVFSYAGQLFFALLAAETLPQLDRLGAYVTDAFAELEAAVLHAHPRAPARAEVRTVPAPFDDR